MAMLFNHATKVICEPLLLIKYLVGRRINYTIGLKGNENYIFSMLLCGVFDDISCHYIAKINVEHIVAIIVLSYYDGSKFLLFRKFICKTFML